MRLEQQIGALDTAYAKTQSAQKKAELTHCLHLAISVFKRFQPGFSR